MGSGLIEGFRLPACQKSLGEAEVSWAPRCMKAVSGLVFGVWGGYQILVQIVESLLAPFKHQVGLSKKKACKPQRPHGESIQALEHPSASKLLHQAGV